MKSSIKKWAQKIVRKKDGPVKVQSGRIIRSNDELQVMYRKPNIVATIKVRRVEWAGNVVRMSHDRTVTKVSGQTRWKKKSRETKIEVVRLY
jgi:hypothetical protein